MSAGLPPIGPLDLHLFGEGTHRRLWELLGPQDARPTPSHSGGVRFSVWAPNASRVSFVGVWYGWNAEPLAEIGADEPPGSGSEGAPAGLWSVASAAAERGDR
jgi:1,4-alpha-glucan branching enzyme